MAEENGETERGPGKPLKELTPEQMKEHGERYIAGEDPEKLAKELGMSGRTFRKIMKDAGITRRTTKGAAMAKIRKKETEAMGEEAEKVVTLGWEIGGMIARGWFPLIDKLLSEDKSIKFIVEDIMHWYESKKSTLTQIAQLEGGAEALADENEKLGIIAAPNIRFKLKMDAYKECWELLFRAAILDSDMDVDTLNKKLTVDMQTIDKLTPDELTSRLK